MGAIATTKPLKNTVISPKQAAFEFAIEFEAEANMSVNVSLVGYDSINRFETVPTVAIQNDSQLKNADDGITYNLATGENLKFFYGNMIRAYQFNFKALTDEIIVKNFGNFPYLKILVFENLKKENGAVLFDKILPEVTLVFCSTSSLFDSFSDFEKFKSVSGLNIPNNNLASVGNIEKITTLSGIDVAGNNFNQSALDELVRKLYLNGDLFTGTGKNLDISAQQAGDTASGNLTDSPSSGTGQGYINGLIDEFSWTIIQ